MKYYRRLKLYKGCNGNVAYNPDTGEAYSYKWWLFHVIIEGVSIFNYSFYSKSTCKHQSRVRGLLGKEPDIILRHTNVSLSNIEVALNDELTTIQLKVDALTTKALLPRTRKPQKYLDEVLALKQQANIVGDFLRKLEVKHAA